MTPHEHALRALALFEAMNTNHREFLEEKIAEEVADAVAWEREACAQIAEEFTTVGYGRPPGVRIAAQIRARGK